MLDDNNGPRSYEMIEKFLRTQQGLGFLSTYCARIGCPSMEVLLGTEIMASKKDHHNRKIELIVRHCRSPLHESLLSTNYSGLLLSRSLIARQIRRIVLPSTSQALCTYGRDETARTPVIMRILMALITSSAWERAKPGSTSSQEAHSREVL